MKLYDMPSNTNSWKIRSVAREMDMPLEIVPIDPLKGDHKTPEFLKINPNGKFPVLVDGDFKLFESNAILCYVAAKGGSRLLPTDVKARAHVDQWLFWQSAHLSQAFGKITYERFYKEYLKTGLAPDQARIAEGEAELDRFCTVLDGVLKDSEYVCGELTVADFALAGTLVLRGRAQVDLSKFKYIGQWLKLIESRSSWIHSEKE